MKREFSLSDNKMYAILFAMVYAFIIIVVCSNCESHPYFSALFGMFTTFCVTAIAVGVFMILNEKAK